MSYDQSKPNNWSREVSSAFSDVNTYMSVLIFGFQELVQPNAEAARRFATTEFKNTNGKLAAEVFEATSIACSAAADRLGEINLQLRAAFLRNELPSKEILAEVLIVIGGIANLGRDAASTIGKSRAWRWDPDYKPLKYALDPINQLEGDTVDFALKQLLPSIRELIRATN